MHLHGRTQQNKESIMLFHLWVPSRHEKVIIGRPRRSGSVNSNLILSSLYLA
jgi:hypothetical protein